MTLSSHVGLTVCASMSDIVCICSLPRITSALMHDANVVQLIPSRSAVFARVVSHAALVKKFCVRRVQGNCAEPPVW